MTKKKKENLVIEPGIYKHYKEGEYKVFSCAKYAETQEDLVICQRLSDGVYVVRSQKLFFTKIKAKGKKVPRFEFVRAEVADYEHLYKRALADYQNLVKQSAQEKQDFIKYANENFILEILPVFDNLKVSIASLSEEEANNPWVEGIKYVIKQFQDVLSEAGVEEIKTEGQKFNPEEMEAMEGKGERVGKQVKPGYKLKGKVITPAKVVLEK